MLRPLRPGTGFLRPDAQKGISLRLQGLVGLPPKEDAGLAYAQQCWLPGSGTDAADMIQDIQFRLILQTVQHLVHRHGAFQ